MKNKEKIEELIFEAIDEFNAGLSDREQLGKSLDTLLFDKSAKLDSLGLVNLSIIIEQKIEQSFNIRLSLFNDNVNYQIRDPLKTVGSLINYISWLLEDKVS